MFHGFRIVAKKISLNLLRVLLYLVDFFQIFTLSVFFIEKKNDKKRETVVALS